MRRELPVYIPDDFYIGGLYKLQAKIDSSVIDATLTNFPVGIDLSATSFIAGRSATDWQNLHVLSGSTECQVEIDVWDMTTPQAIIWVKVPSISSSVDTDLWISFGSDNTTTYVGQTGDAAAQSVWDSNFVAVYHMSQDPSGGSGAILDSTSNANNGTSAGTMTSGDLVDAGFGKAIDFDGTDDYVRSDIGTTSNSITYTFYSSFDTTATKRIITRDWGAAIEASTGSFTTHSSSSNFYASIRNSSDTAVTNSPSTSLNTSTYYVYDVVYDGSNLKTYIDGSQAATNPSASIKTDSNDLFIGATEFNFDGQISEVRISNTARSAAWIKATNAVLAKTLVTLS